MSKMNLSSLTKEAVLDTLTGLFNHSYFHETLERELIKAKKYALPLSVAFLDLDSFFHLNRILGYFQGDLLLKEVAKIITSHLEESDIACRYKEDELVIIFPKRGQEEALGLLEQIRLSLAQKLSPQVKEATSQELTLSAGIASSPLHAHTAQDLILKAQKALSQAKIKGKNRCCLYNPSSEYFPSTEAFILVVDDDPDELTLIENLISPLNLTVLKASDGFEALSLIKCRKPDLILMDVKMPHLNGYETCKRLKEEESTRLIPIILISSLSDLNDKITGIEVGSDDFLIKPVRRTELVARVNSFLRVKRLNDQMENLENVIFSLANAVEAKDKYTLGHTERVTFYAVSLGQAIGLKESSLQALKIGGALHDIGKIGVPGSILNKPGPLTAEEWGAMKKHPEIGYTICLPLKERLGEALAIVRHHHEKLNGTGYPDGLKGDDIPLVARIMAIADIYDALTVDRPYRGYLPKKEALKILKNESIQGFLDREIVCCFERILSSP